MNPFIYVKAVIGAVGGAVFPPIFQWLTGYIPAPHDVQLAVSILLVALVTGGAVYATPNQQKVASGPVPDANRP